MDIHQHGNVVMVVNDSLSTEKTDDSYSNLIIVEFETNVMDRVLKLLSASHLLAQPIFSELLSVAKKTGTFETEGLTLTS